MRPDFLDEFVSDKTPGSPHLQQTQCVDVLNWQVCPGSAQSNADGELLSARRRPPHRTKGF
eukprot:14383763-Alexandrium_andersonii.AAC.1